MRVDPHLVAAARTGRAALRLGALRAGVALGSLIAPAYTVDHAARLFATPYASSRRRTFAAATDREMQPDEILSHGESIATYVWGDPASQPYVLLAHGWSSFGLRFLTWIARLREQGFAVVSFDQPGHGASSGRLCTLPDFVATVRVVGGRFGEPALAIGHSLGAAALAFAQDQQWRAQRVVLVAPVADMESMAARFMRFVYLRDGLRERFLAWHERRTGVQVRDLQIHRHLPALSQPALVIHDLEDDEVPWSDGERYARFWPSARLLTTQGLGHHHVLDSPQAMDAALAFARGENIGERVVASSNLPFGVA